MKRTIEVNSFFMSYRDKDQSWLNDKLCVAFGLHNGKFAVTIKIGTKFQFVTGANLETGTCEYGIYDKNGKYYGFVCKSIFNEFFFKPDCRKRYDITVKKVK